MKARNLIVSLTAGSVALLFSVGFLSSAARAASRSFHSLGDRRASTGLDLGASDLLILGPDIPPEAVDDQAETNEDTPVTIEVLANDSDAETIIVFLESFSNPSQQGGSVARDDRGTSFRNDDRLIYTPPLNFSGTDTFSYTIEDSFFEQDTATVTVTVHPVNDAPTAVSDIYTATQNTLLDVPALAGVLVNDSDPEGDLLAAVWESDPINGGLEPAPDGGFKYTPNPGFVGQDIFTYHASDGQYDSNQAEVVINVADAQQPLVTWTSPVGDQDVLNVTDQVVILEVQASDNQFVNRVQFYRWDPAQETYLDLATLTAPPYRIELDTSTVNLGWNQINARAYDNAGNPSEVGYIWLYRVMEVFLPVSLR